MRMTDLLLWKHLGQLRHRHRPRPRLCLHLCLLLVRARAQQQQVQQKQHQRGHDTPWGVNGTKCDGRITC